MKQLCKCGKLAVWWYMPNTTYPVYCDDCVKRGCSCNVDPDTGIEDMDEQGRLLPCCEWGYAEEGIDFNEV